VADRGLVRREQGEVTQQTAPETRDVKETLLLSLKYVYAKKIHTLPSLQTASAVHSPRAGLSMREQTA